MEPRSPALQTNSLPSKPPGKPALHQLSLCCSLCSECLHSGFFHSPLPPSIPGFWLFFHPFFFLSSHINVLFITDYKLCTTSVEQFLSFSCKLVAFYLRDGILKATFNWKYTFCKTNPVKWHSSLCSPAKVAMPCGSHNVNTAHAACQLWNSVILEKEFSIHSISIILCYVHKTFIFSLRSFGFAFFTITLIWPYIAWWWGDPFQR